MPSFELVVPESFLFIPANLSFISFCFFISFLLSRILKSTILFFVLLISLLSIAYYDIFVKYAIRNYYSFVKMDSQIYAKTPKNSEFKIESLSMIGVYVHPLKYSTSLSETEMEDIEELHEHYIEKFIDISTYSYKFNRYILNNERVYLNGNLPSIKDQTARFEVTKKLVETYLPKIYGKYEYRFVDKQTNIVLATAFNIFFVNSNDKFRNRYLYWNLQKEEDFNLPAIQNFDIIYKKVLIDN